MTDWKEHKELQQALQTYLSKHNLMLSGSVVYESGIDCFEVLAMESEPVDPRL